MERLQGEMETEICTDTSFGNIKEGRSQVKFVVGIRDYWGKKISMEIEEGSESGQD